RILLPHLHLLRVHHISTPLSPPRCPVGEERRPGFHRVRISAVRDRLIERLRCVVARGTGHPNNPGGLCLIGRLRGGCDVLGHGPRERVILCRLVQEPLRRQGVHPILFGGLRLRTRHH